MTLPETKTGKPASLTTERAPKTPARGVITQKDLARLAGVSLTTVYNALHAKDLVREKTRRHIYRIMEEYDYQPNAIARAMVRGKTDVLGVIVPRIDVPYYASLVGSIEPYVNSSGYNCIICQHLDDMLKEEREIRLMRERRVDGMIIRASGTREDPTVYRRLENNATPFVLIDRRIEGLEEHFVGPDDQMATRQITSYLINKGHKRIAAVCWRETRQSLGVKYESFRETMDQHGLEATPELTVECRTEYFGGRAETLEMMRRVGARKPTALLVLNDATIVGVIQAVREIGLTVPDDIAIANVGGYVEGSLGPLLPFRLTCSVQPLGPVAREAAQMLRDQIDGDNWQRGPILCPPALRIGDTA